MIRYAHVHHRVERIPYSDNGVTRKGDDRIHRFWATHCHTDRMTESCARARGGHRTIGQEKHRISWGTNIGLVCIQVVGMQVGTLLQGVAFPSACNRRNCVTSVTSTTAVPSQPRLDAKRGGLQNRRQVDAARIAFKWFSEHPNNSIGLQLQGMTEIQLRI
jgi:hypothetical protein